MLSVQNLCCQILSNILTYTFNIIFVKILSELLFFFFLNETWCIKETGSCLGNLKVILGTNQTDIQITSHKLSQ